MYAIRSYYAIGALMALKLWITEGIFDSIHPSALVIFVAALVLALVLKKGFCGWICVITSYSIHYTKLYEDAIRKTPAMLNTTRFLFIAYSRSGR